MRVRRLSVGRAWALGGLALAATLLVTTLSDALVAHAEDGRVEINQACALGPGCLVDDAPGFPVTIDASAPKSFVLTGDLSVAGANTDAIAISAGGVSLDLNGFSISGPVTCTGSGSTLVCDPGVGRGIVVASVAETSVFNGTVRGFADSGLILGDRSRVEAISVIGNGFSGLEAGASSVVRHVIAYRNGFDGISLGDGSTVEGCIGFENRFYGILSADDVSAVGIVAIANGSDGIHCGDGGLVRGAAVRANEGDGIDCQNGSHVSESAVSTNDGDGIEATRYSTARANAIYNNDGVGIDFVQTGNTFGENMIFSNTGGAVSGGVSAGGNSCLPACP